MTRNQTQFEFYSGLANLDISETMKNGRYPIQEEAEKLIVPDVMRKLAPRPDDVLLDIGFGSGTILVPFSYMVKEAVGIDNANAVSNLSKAIDRPNIRLVTGAFPDVSLPEMEFSLVTVYSVLHALPNREAVLSFIRAAAKLLAPGGRILFGDIPNADLKMRFQASAAGEAFEEEWRKRIARLSEDQLIKPPEIADPAPFDDAFAAEILLTLRGIGLDAYLMAQDPNLPFGNTREDIVATKRL